MKLLLMILVGGLIGYTTNKVAIKMLFRPINPHKFFFFTIQGVFPKRKDVMAVSLAETIEKELLSKDEILNSVLTEDNISTVKNKIKDALIIKIKEVIPNIVLMMLNDNIEDIINNFIDKEGNDIFNNLLDDLKNSSLDTLDIKALVKKRIDELDFIEFEKIIFGLMSKELKHIEVIGLVLGCLIGVVQYFITGLL